MFRLLRECVLDESLRQKLLESPRLPTLPAVALQVIDLVADEHAHAEQIAAVIEKDPALSSKILRTVNSSFYALPRRCSTIRHALVVLGLKTVRTLALGFTLVRNLQVDPDSGMDHFAFWRRSLYAASTARTLAQHTRVADPEEVFLCGLLQDLGMLTLHQVLGPAYAPLLTDAQNRHRLLPSFELAQLNTDHTQVGAMLAEHWRLPPQLVDAIRYHERPDLAPPNSRDAVRCVAVGNDVADLFAGERTDRWLRQYYQHAYQWFCLTPARAQPLLQQVHTCCEQMKNLFELPTGPLAEASHALAEANAMLARIGIEQLHENQRLREQNEQLHQQVNADPLTGVGNRRKLQARLDELAETEPSPLSFLMIDLDRFKQVNDRFGHCAGDQVLVSLAQILKEHVPAEASLYRFGGEEFVAVLPHVDPGQAKRVAEGLAQAVRQLPIAITAGPMLPVTVSIGIAGRPAGRTSPSVSQLIEDADTAMYHVKQTGRDGVALHEEITVRSPLDRAA